MCEISTPVDSSFYLFDFHSEYFEMSFKSLSKKFFSETSKSLQMREILRFLPYVKSLLRFCFSFSGLDGCVVVGIVGI